MNRLIASFIGLILMVQIMPASAQQTPPAETNDSACRIEIGTMLAKEHDLYRRALFGSTGGTLVSGEGDASILRTGGVIKEKDGYGIFATPERMTSELIEPAIEAYRTFRCRSYAVCQLVNASLDATEITQVPIQPLGCESEDRVLVPQCFLSVTSPSSSTVDVFQYCTRVVTETMTFERRVLQLAVAYDSGYRALLQFSGMFDAFLVEVPKRTFTVLREMLSLLGRLHQVPCFTAHCDLPPVDSIPPIIP